MSIPYRPISCELHDHLEIACLHRYRLLIELTDGRQFEARALDTDTAASKEEFLVVAHEDITERLRLDHLLAITPLDAHARYGRVRF
jgi:Rho-binding antiterminator